MISVRYFEHTDTDRCVALLRKGHDRSFTRSRFEWLHFQNPLAPSLMIVAENKGEIVGLYTAIKKHVSINGKIYVGARDVDPVVHPDYRGKKIFSRMIEHCLETSTDIDFHFNFANTISSHGYVKAGWKVVGFIPECLLQTGYDRIVSKNFLLYVMSRLKHRRSGQAGKWVDTLKPEDFAGLASDTGVPVSVVRSQKYLAWRYLDNPTRSYTFAVETIDNLYSKILVGRYDQDRKAFLAHDVIFRSPAAETSVHFVINAMMQSNFQCLRTWRTCSPSLRRKMISNPLNKRSSLRFLVKERPGKGLPEHIYHLNSWLLTPGDLEFL